MIKGRPGTQNNASALIVTQGGKIFAEGTPTRPIIFTAEADDVTDPDDLPLFERGLWGGLVLLGRASINTSLNTAGNAASPKYDVFEGLPDSQINGQFVHRFGGADDEDSSGVLRYVSIRHAGTQFQPNKELNGLSLAGVGRGTVLEFVEVYAAADDGFEFFGGTVNTKYLVSAFGDDDLFDTDQGWRGRNQFWFGIQEPGKKDNGGELNGEPNGAAVNATPVAAYEVYNATWIGAGSGTTGNRGMTIREYAAPKFYNCIFTDFGGSAVRIDDKSALHLQSGLLDLRDNLFFGFAGPLAENATAEEHFTDSSRNNRNLDPQLRGISREANGGLDPRPAPGSPALTSPRQRLLLPRRLPRRLRRPQLGHRLDLLGTEADSHGAGRTQPPATCHPAASGTTDSHGSARGQRTGADLDRHGSQLPGAKESQSDRHRMDGPRHNQ